MNKYTCTICDYVYDEAAGVPEQGIGPNTKWDDLPEDWTCPVCGAAKDSFFSKQNDSSDKIEITRDEAPPEVNDISSAELSALFSNLSKGCEKQYREKEADLFEELADYFKSKSKLTDDKTTKDIKELIDNDLEVNFTQAKNIAESEPDRGALRAVVWSEKVTKIISSLLDRYEKEGYKLLEDNNIYVCTICGFIYIGDEASDICPVCKVPDMKIEEIQRR